MPEGTWTLLRVILILLVLSAAAAHLAFFILLFDDGPAAWGEHAYGLPADYVDDILLSTRTSLFFFLLGTFLFVPAVLSLLVGSGIRFVLALMAYILGVLAVTLLYTPAPILDYGLWLALKLDAAI